MPAHISVRVREEAPEAHRATFVHEKWVEEKGRECARSEAKDCFSLNTLLHDLISFKTSMLYLTHKITNSKES